MTMTDFEKQQWCEAGKKINILENQLNKSQLENDELQQKHDTEVQSWETKHNEKKREIEDLKSEKVKLKQVRKGT